MVVNSQKVDGREGHVIDGKKIPGPRPVPKPGPAAS